MIQVAHFTHKFFVELVKHLQIYNVLYVTEDGNIYRTENQAITRCIEKEKLAHINGEDVDELRWAKVTSANPPSSSEEFELMLESQYKERRDAARKEVKAADEVVSKVTMTDEEAEDLLNKKSAKSQEVDENEFTPKFISINGVEYPFEKVREAIRSTVNPKFHASSGFEKVRSAYEALADECKEKVNKAILE